MRLLHLIFAVWAWCFIGSVLEERGENGLMLSIAGVRIALGMDSSL